MSFFSAIADQLVRTLNPRTVMDAGCAMGLLVEALWDRGVEAWGIDVSPYAISQVRRDIRPYCTVASLAEPFAGRYDLIVCIEVLEHMPEDQSVQAIQNLALAGDTILFSSSPNDFTEPTHFNVHQPMWWLAQFEKVGFAPDLLFDCTFLTPQAMLLRKSDKPLAYEVQRLFADLPRSRNRTIAAEERVRQLTAEMQGLQQALAASQAMETELSTLREQYRISAGEVVKQSEQVARCTAAVEQLNKELSTQSEKLAACENRAAAGEERILQLTAEVEGFHQARAVSQALESELSTVSEQYRISAEEVLRQREEVARHAASKGECQRMSVELDDVRGQVSSMRSLLERCEQRGTIFLQQIEQSEGSLQELQQTVAEHSLRWERHLSSQRAVCSNLESRCMHLSVSFQSMEPRVADAELRTEELSRLHLNIQQQVASLAAQVREILHSRIWKALVGAGGLLLRVTGRRQ